MLLQLALVEDWRNLLLLQPRVIVAVHRSTQPLRPAARLQRHLSVRDYPKAVRLLPHSNPESRGLCLPGCVFKFETASVWKEMLVWMRLRSLTAGQLYSCSQVPGLSCISPHTPSFRHVVELSNTSITTSPRKPWFCHF